MLAGVRDVSTFAFMPRRGVEESLGLNNSPPDKEGLGEVKFTRIRHHEPTKYAWLSRFSLASAPSILNGVGHPPQLRIPCGLGFIGARHFAQAWGMMKTLGIFLTFLGDGLHRFDKTVEGFF